MSRESPVRGTFGAYATTTDSATGRPKTKVEPCPGVLRASRGHSWSSRIRLLMARPRPLPPGPEPLDVAR